jgi:hypothetical protein
MSRRHDLRRIRAHWNYTARELAEALDVTLSTIRVWTREGLQPIEGSWPYIFGHDDIIRFLERRNKPRCPLAPGELLCVACKKHRVPAGNSVALLPRSPTSSDLIGACPVCSRRMHRRVCLASLAKALGSLTVRYEDGNVPIGKGGRPPRTAPNRGERS